MRAINRVPKLYEGGKSYAHARGLILNLLASYLEGIETPASGASSYFYCNHFVQTDVEIVDTNALPSS